MVLDDISKHYGGVYACRNVSLTVCLGEVLGIVGPNGAGKSTLFNCITNFEPIDSGEITFAGRNIHRMTAESTNRQGIARTFQNLRPFPSMTLLENVMVGALGTIRTVRLAREWAVECLEYVGMLHKKSALASTLSTGQRKRLELARALATRPRLLLLDEVTAGVDIGAIEGLLNLVAMLKADNMTLIVIEHDMRVIRELSDRLVAMHMGQIIADGDPESVVKDEIVVNSYLGRFHA